MIEVAPGLFVGNQIDYETRVKDEDGWAVVHACKEPYHRAAVGYSSRGCPREDPEYLWADRGDRLMLNIVDVDDVAYIKAEIVEKALAFIRAWLDQGRNVLVHCNQGGSRAPTIALLYLGRWSPDYFGLTPEEAVRQFTEVYRQYAPAKGMRDYLDLHYPT